MYNKRSGCTDKKQTFLNFESMASQMEMEEPLYEPVAPKPKRRRSAKTPAVKKEKKASGPPNKWIAHYMQWRADNPQIVAETKNIGALVKLARESYTPVKPGIVCSSCGAHNSPPYNKPKA